MGMQRYKSYYRVLKQLIVIPVDLNVFFVGLLLIFTPFINTVASHFLDCVIAKNCTECINLTGKTGFSCSWCSEINR